MTPPTAPHDRKRPLHLTGWIGLLLLAIIAALVVGLFEQTQELRRIAEALSNNDCVSAKSEFSHAKFVGYHLAILLLVILGGVYAALVGGYFGLRRFAETVFRQFP
jgi:hypothetical protein